eukprot:g35267.t1
MMSARWRGTSVANGGNGANGLKSRRTRAANRKPAGRSNHECTPPSPMLTTGPKAPPNSVRCSDAVCEIAPGPYELVTSVTANQNLVVPLKLTSRQSSARSASEFSCDMLLVSDALPLAWVNHQDEDFCVESNPVGSASQANQLAVESFDLEFYMT